MHLSKLALGSAVATAMASFACASALCAATTPQVAYRPAQPTRINFSGTPEPGLEASLDLRPQIRARKLAVRDQGNRGTCSVFATTFLIEYQKAGMLGQPIGLALSEEYLNWAQNKVAGKPYQDGGFFTRMIAGYQTWAISTAAEMPYQSTYDPSNPVQPTSAAKSSAQAMFPQKYPFVFLKNWDDTHGYTMAELNNVIASLRSGRPVATGIWWLTNFATVKVHGVPLLKDYPRSAETGPNPPMFDGHSIDLVGFRESNEFPGGGYFIFRNSFGPSFGDHGYGFVSFQYLRAYGNDAIAIAPPPWRPIYPKNAPKY